MRPGISVVICCFNSALRLPETLRHLSLQKAKLSFPWEVVIVDNASTDQTAAEAQRLWNLLHSPVVLRVVTESKSGLAYARQKGVSEAKYNIVLFCDDDNWLSDAYLETVYEIMESQTDVGIVGGVGTAVTDGKLPSWFDQYKKYYACYPQAIQSGKLESPIAFLYGAGMAIRTSLFHKALNHQPPFINTGRKGQSLVSGEDSELCYRIILLGSALWYSDKLKFKHYIPQHRLSKAYLLKIISAIGYSSMRLLLYHYVLLGNKVSKFTWAKDISYRFFQVSKTYFSSFFGFKNFENQVLREISIQSFRAVWEQRKNYLITYKELLSLKKN